MNGPHFRWCAAIAAAALLAGCARDAEKSTLPSPTAAATALPLEGGAPAEARALLPDLQTLEPSELYIEDGVDSRRLRFSTTLLNAGEGPLELFGVPEPTTGTITALQRIFRQDKSVTERAAGRFLFDDPHEHWHFEDLTIFELWSYDAAGELNELLATTGKATFCAVDEAPLLDHAPPPTYLGCGEGVQGLSAGWIDTYEAALPGQELDITGVDDGRYAIRTTVDPDGLIVESDDGNNSMIRYLEVRNVAVEALDGPDGPTTP